MVKTMKKNLKSAHDARKPKIVFDCKEYTVSRIPRNYRIDIKTTCSPKHPNRGIDRDCYSDPEKELDYAKQMAEETISEYFVKDNGAYRANLKHLYKPRTHGIPQR